jgi:hypothetical protein
VLYVVIAAAWCLLALFALAICRLSSLSDDAHALELADCLLAARVGRGPADEDAGVEESGEAWRATG